MNLLTYDDEKYVSNNIEQIIKAIKEIVEIEVTLKHFKEWKNDKALFISCRDNTIILEYNEVYGKYFILMEKNNHDNIQYEIQCEAISLYNICSKIKRILYELNNEFYSEIHKISNNINKCIGYGKTYLNIELSEAQHFRDYYDDVGIYFSYNLEQFRITYDMTKKKYLLGHKNKSGGAKYSSDSYHNDGECSDLAEVFNRASTRHNPFKRGKIGHRTKIDDLFDKIKS